MINVFDIRLGISVVGDPQLQHKIYTHHVSQLPLTLTIEPFKNDQWRVVDCQWSDSAINGIELLVVLMDYS